MTHSTDSPRHDKAQMYELLVRELTDYAVFLVSPTGRINSWNPGVERVLGYSEPEWIGKPLSMIFTPEDRAARRPETEMATALRDGRAPDFRWHERKDGTRILVDGVLVRLRDATGTAVGFSKVMQDVTERERKEQELRIARDDAHAILESITDAFCAYDREWRFVYVNAAAEALLGIRRDQILGKTQWELFPSTEGTVVEQAYRRAVREQVPVELEFFYEEWQRWFAIRCYPTREGGLSIYFRDITDRQRAEQEREQLNNAVNRRAAELEAILASMPDALYIGDEKGITRANQLALDQLGFSSIDELRENIARVAERLQTRDPRTGTRLRPEEEPFARALRGETVAREVATTHLLTGDEVIVRCSARPIELDGSIVGAVAINTDVTAQKRAEAALARQAEELARSNADLQQFAYAASHDLQEPLRTILSYSQLLQRRFPGQLGGDADQFLQQIVSGGQRMRGLIDSLLKYARAVNAEVTPLVPVRLESVLHWASMNLKTMIDESHAVITSGELPTVEADQVQLVQVLQNLIANAIKYRRAQEAPRVHISAERCGDQWVISVRDNGIGIRPEHTDRIFGVFKRLHGQELPGTGMGLAIAKRIVERHGGRIWLESEPGVGSTFYFTLPAV